MAGGLAGLGGWRAGLGWLAAGYVRYGPDVMYGPGGWRGGWGWAGARLGLGWVAMDGLIGFDIHTYIHR